MSKQKRNKPEEITSILNQHVAGLKTAEIYRQGGFGNQALCRWKSKDGGMGTPEVKRPKQLEDQNRRLNQVVAGRSLDMRVMKTIIEGKY
ncbi:MAG: transposase [Pseudomonadota bacterium]